MAKRTTSEEFSDYVPHPRFGQGPRSTGVDLSQEELKENGLHWRYSNKTRVRETGIKADVSAQAQATFPLRYYFDVRRTCQDCGKKFLFFAEEQRFWYQVLQFPLEADAVRCVPCRKIAQDTSRLIERYEELVHEERDAVQQLEFAEIVMCLLERRVFGPTTVDRLRGALKRLPDGDQLTDLRERLAALLERGLPGEIVLRPMEEGDRSRVLQLVRSQGTHGCTDAFHSAATDDEIWEHWWAEGRGHGFTATLEDRLIGAFVLRRDHPGQGRHVARASYVLASRPRAHGAGRKLVVASLEAAQELGYLALQLSLWVDDRILPLALWESLGFDALGIVPRGIQHPDGSYRESYILHRGWG